MTATLLNQFEQFLVLFENLKSIASEPKRFVVSLFTARRTKRLGLHISVDCQRRRAIAKLASRAR